MPVSHCVSYSRKRAVRASMSRKGNCSDNAGSGTLFGSLKVERLHGQHFETVRQARDEVLDWLLWYITRRDFIRP
jgi:putative transposase